MRPDTIFKLEYDQNALEKKYAIQNICPSVIVNDDEVDLKVMQERAYFDWRNRSKLSEFDGKKSINSKMSGASYLKGGRL